MIRVYILYALSGFVSLGYQVTWFRIFTDWFGSTNLTFALVVANFHYLIVLRKDGPDTKRG